ncbi:MAG: hypothetical protein AAF360_12585 [Pseudomonadota bacterium]
MDAWPMRPPAIAIYEAAAVRPRAYSPVATRRSLPSFGAALARTGLRAKRHRPETPSLYDQATPIAKDESVFLALENERQNYLSLKTIIYETFTA